MKRLTVLILTLLFIITGAASAEMYVDSQVVCHVRPNADPDTVAATVGALVADEIESVNVYLLYYRNSTPIDSVITLLEKNPDVTHAQPNYVIKINQDQVSQPFVDQISQPFVDGVSPEPYYDQYAVTNMMIDTTHLINGGTGQVIAIIDGGVDDRHPLFESRLHYACYDFVDVDYQPWVYDGIIGNHGTFVAGVAARAARGAELMIVRCFSTSGSSTSFRVAQGICHAAENGADIINMSFGMDHADNAIQSAIVYAYQSFGLVLTASAGNQNLEIDRFPACHPYVMNIAAVDENDIKAEFSNFGHSINATAAGVEIYSSLCGADTSWGWWSGTSFSAPFAAGLAALVRSIYPFADPEFIVERILMTADNIDYLNPSYTFFLGSGRINFIKAAYLPGDANGSGSINLGDVVFIVNYIFRDGPLPVPPEAGDANCDLYVNVGDAVFTINYIFNDGPAPGCD